jgi:hypothetical protein
MTTDNPIKSGTPGGRPY